MASPKDKEYKLADGGGLYLRVRPTGGKTWLFLFRLKPSRDVHKMTLGQVKDLSLKEARARILGLRYLVRCGVDPRDKQHDIMRASEAAFIKDKVEALPPEIHDKIYDIWRWLLRTGQIQDPLLNFLPVKLD